MLNVNRTIREHAWQTAPLGRAAWAGAMGLAGATRIPYQGRMTAPAGVDVRQFAALIERVARLRDRVAFAQLFHHFAPRVKAYLMRLGSGSDAAEELAQEVMLTVWRRAETFDAARAGASTWIFAIARNRRIDALRRAPRINFEPDDPDLAPTAPAAPDEAADAHDWERKLGAALGDLPDEQAQMLKLADYDDRSHSEIAEALHVPLGTVKSRLRLAIGRLRAKFEDKQ
jgi:RNA polymerase sigma-70 factor (ECF subfamily)